MKFRPIVKKILTWLYIACAKAILWKYRPRVFVLTGSVGKTSAKNAIYTVLRRFQSVRRNVIQGNALGLALTIIGGDPNPSAITQIKNLLKWLGEIIFRQEYPKWLLLELAVREPNDLMEIMPWLKPDGLLITYFGETPPHVEFFKSRHHLIETKLKILRNLKKDGFVIVNADDPDFEFIKEKIALPFTTFGFKESADIFASNSQLIYENGFPAGLNFKLNYSGHSLPVNIKGALGKNHIYAFLAAFALTDRLRFNMIEASQEASRFVCPAGRLCLLAGRAGSLVIDDSYNSSPAALMEALATLREIEAPGRKIALLGDMLELGRDTYAAHREAGLLAGKIVDFLITIGPRAAAIGEGARRYLKVANYRHFSTTKEINEFLKQFINAGDVVLVKGSRKMELEKIVEEIKAPQESRES
jgi:UDP-N-acetylmuramoyl-tripeptide--D-alanyl-D-alanine ligase